MPSPSGAGSLSAWTPPRPEASRSQEHTPLFCQTPSVLLMLSVVPASLGHHGTSGSQITDSLQTLAVPLGFPCLRRRQMLQAMLVEPARAWRPHAMGRGKVPKTEPKHGALRSAPLGIWALLPASVTSARGSRWLPLSRQPHAQDGAGPAHCSGYSSISPEARIARIKYRPVNHKIILT